jgi:CspA family cold shock protein
MRKKNRMTRHRSHIKWFNNSSGFGFLYPVDATEGRDVAIRHDSIVDKLPGEIVELYEGDILTFEVEDAGKGPRAVNVRREGYVVATQDEWRVLAAMVLGFGKLAFARQDSIYRVTGPDGCDVPTDIMQSLLKKRLIEAGSSVGLYQVSAAGRRAYKEREKEMADV